MPDAHTTAATSLAIVSSGAFTHFETHELIEASDLTAIAERARGDHVSAAGRLAGTKALGYIPRRQSGSPAAG